MLRSLFAFAIVAAWGGASYAQTACDPEAFEMSCNTDGTIQYCDDTTTPSAPVEASISCAEDVGAGTCGTPGCNGSGCSEFGVGCVAAAVGDACIGISPQIDGDNTNDNLAYAVQCSGDLTCAVTVDGSSVGDTCQAHVGPACTAGNDESTCTGTVLSFCLADADGTFALTSNVAIDCTLFEGSTCGQQACECDAQCGDNSTCTGGFCDYGVTCTFDADPADCGAGEGEGEGEEGEGEGDAECESDRDCDDGEICTDGQCEADSAEPAPLCSDTGSSKGLPAAGLLALAGMVLGLRRRRA